MPNRTRWVPSLGLSLMLAACSSSSNESAADAGSTGLDGSSKGSAPDGATPSHDTPTSTTPADAMAGGSAATGANTVDSSPLLGTAERGQYLVDHVLMCGVCHTPSLDNGEPDMTRYLAGSRSYDFKDSDDAGTIVTVNAENLTSHDPEGLHSWTNDQIRTAITKGIDDEKVAIYPIMPYQNYALLTPDDVDSIIRYLRTVPPNDNVVPADYPYSDQHPPVPAVDDTKVPHTTLAPTDPAFAAAERGRYLAKTACLYCHTEELSAGVPNLSKAFAGGKTYTFVRLKPPQTSTNLTPHATGLASWSIDDIATALKTNQEKGTGRTFCNTHPGGPERLGKMTDGDRTDIATYLHTLPPVANGPFQCLSQ